MDITPLLSAHVLPIRRYGPAGFTVGEGAQHAGSIFLSAQGAEALSGTAEAQIERGIALAASQPEIELLLIGTGAQMQFVEDQTRQALRARGIASEIMDTGAACRTYNVLLAEGRRVAAVLLLPV